MSKRTPKPNAPNTTAWTRPLVAPAPAATKAPKPGTRAYTVSLWTAPLDVALATGKGVRS
jgi:hypothetical protein